MITWFISILLLTSLDVGYSWDITPIVNIIVSFPPSQFHKLESNGTKTISVKRGSNLVMECQVLDKPQDDTAQTFWKLYPYNYEKNKTEILINNGMTSQDHSRYKVGQGREPDSIRMEILTADESYGGIYACEVQYSATVVNARAEVTVQIFDSPSVSYTEYKTNVESNKDVTLTCKASGIPPPNVFWKRIGGESNIIKNTGVVTYGISVTLAKVTYKDAGTYACVAENKWGSVERKFSLSVKHAPVISITPNGPDASQKVGCMLQLTCVIKADPAPGPVHVSWNSKRLASTLSNNKRITLKHLRSSNQETFFILRIYPTTKEDLNDEYSCKATNQYGDGTNSVTVIESETSNQMMLGPFPCSAQKTSMSLVVMIIGYSIHKYII